MYTTHIQYTANGYELATVRYEDQINYPVFHTLGA